MVALRQMPADLVLFPAWVLVPRNLVLVDQHDVGFTIAVHVGQLQAVTNAYFGVDFLLPKLGLFGEQAG